MGLVILTWTAHINYHGRRSIEEHRLILNFYRSDDLQKKYNNIKPQKKLKQIFLIEKRKSAGPTPAPGRERMGRAKMVFQA